MTIPKIALTGVALLAMAQTAEAAPKVSGKYALMIFVQCGARIATTTANFAKPGGGSAPAVASLTSQENGELTIGVGTFTFPSTAASSGSASVELNLVGGDVLRVNGSGSSVGTHTENHAGTFAVTNTSFTFTPTGESAMVWTMRFGDLVSGVARTLYMVRQEDPKCINAVTATKQ
jgi:hypothetical protein